MKHIITLVLVLFTLTVSAQDILVTDTVKTESVTQHPWSENTKVDTCTTNLAVVHDKYGRCGVYDLVKNKNLTELAYRNLHFIGKSTLDDGSQTPSFIGFWGHSRSIITVSDSGQVITFSKIDNDMCYDLESCRTIDNQLSKVCRNLLENDLMKCEALYGQVFVMDSQTGDVKAWVALEDKKNNGIFTDAPLYKHQLNSSPNKAFWATVAMVRSNTKWKHKVDTKNGIDSIGGLRIQDHNWHRGGYGKVSYLYGFTHHSDIAMAKVIEKAMPDRFELDWFSISNKPRAKDAMELAKIYTTIAFDGRRIVEPSVNTDSIKITAGTPSDAELKVNKMFKEYLKESLQGDGIYSKWTTQKVDILGDYVYQRDCRPTLYDDNIKDMDKYYTGECLDTYNQVIFTGFFPSKNPRYTICVSMDKEGLPLSGALIRNTVNGVAEYLNEH